MWANDYVVSESDLALSCHTWIQSTKMVTTKRIQKPMCDITVVKPIFDTVYDCSQRASKAWTFLLKVNSLMFGLHIFHDFTTTWWVVVICLQTNLHLPCKGRLTESIARFSPYSFLQTISSSDCKQPPGTSRLENIHFSLASGHWLVSMPAWMGLKQVISQRLPKPLTSLYYSVKQKQHQTDSSILQLL